MKSCAWLITCSVLICTVLIMMTGLLDTQTAAIERIADEYNPDTSISRVWVPFGRFAVFSLLALMLVRACPNIASQLIGTAGFDSLSIGQATQTLRESAGGIAAGAAATVAARGLTAGYGAAKMAYGAATGNEPLQQRGAELAAAAVMSPSGRFMRNTHDSAAWAQGVALKAGLAARARSQMSNDAIIARGVSQARKAEYNEKGWTFSNGAGLGNVASGASIMTRPGERTTPEQKEWAKTQRENGGSTMNSVYGSSFQHVGPGSPAPGLGSAAAGYSTKNTTGAAHRPHQAPAGSSVYGMAGAAAMASGGSYTPAAGLGSAAAGVSEMRTRNVSNSGSRGARGATGASGSSSGSSGGSNAVYGSSYGAGSSSGITSTGAPGVNPAKPAEGLGNAAGGNAGTRPNPGPSSTAQSRTSSRPRTQAYRNTPPSAVYGSAYANASPNARAGITSTGTPGENPSNAYAQSSATEASFKASQALDQSERAASSSRDDIARQNEALIAMMNHDDYASDQNNDNNY